MLKQSFCPFPLSLSNLEFIYNIEFVLIQENGIRAQLQGLMNVFSE